MRQIQRQRLPAKCSAWLLKNSNQLIANNAISIADRWKDRRKTMNNNGVVAVLESMAGLGMRCMYCCDSEGCDIEHFYPKSDGRWRNRVFMWDNFLWICAKCNRIKTKNFSVDAHGNALLINPVDDHIWDFFDYVEETGQLVAQTTINAADYARATYTISEDVTRLLHEVICEGRKTSSRFIRRAISAYTNSAKLDQDKEEFIISILDSGHPELCFWYFSGIGSNSEPFDSFCRDNANLVNDLQDRLNQSFPGVW